MFQIATTLLALGTLASATVMHVVTVGENGQLAFCPEQITAASGDLVQFQFYPKVLHLAFLVLLIFSRTTPLRKVSLPKAVRPFQMLQRVPHSKVYAYARDKLISRLIFWFHAGFRRLKLHHHPYVHRHCEWHRPRMVLLFPSHALSVRNGVRHQPHR